MTGIGDVIFNLESAVSRETDKLRQDILMVKQSIKRYEEEHQNNLSENEYLQSVIKDLDLDTMKHCQSYNLMNGTVQNMLKTKSLMEIKIENLSKTLAAENQKTSSLRTRTDAELDKYRSQWQTRYKMYEASPKAAVVRELKGKLIRVEETFKAEESSLKQMQAECFRLKCELNRLKNDRGIGNLNTFVVEFAKKMVHIKYLKAEKIKLESDIEKLRSAKQERDALIKKQQEIQKRQQQQQQQVEEFHRNAVSRSQAIAIPKPPNDHQNRPCFQIPKLQLFMPTFMSVKSANLSSRLGTEVGTAARYPQPISITTSSTPTCTLTSMISTINITAPITARKAVRTEPNDIFFTPPALPQGASTSTISEIFITPSDKSLGLREQQGATKSVPIAVPSTPQHRVTSTTSQSTTPTDNFSPGQHARITASLTKTPEFTYATRPMFNPNVAITVSPQGMETNHQIRPDYFESMAVDESEPPGELATEKTPALPSSNACTSNIDTNYQTPTDGMEPQYSEYFQGQGDVTMNSSLNESYLPSANHYFSPEMNWEANIHQPAPDGPNREQSPPAFQFGHQMDKESGDGFSFGFSGAGYKSPTSNNNNPFSFFGGGDDGAETASPEKDTGFKFSF